MERVAKEGSSPSRAALTTTAGETSALSSLNTEAWTRELRQIQSAATFHRLELECAISSMRTQVHAHVQ